MKNIKGKWIFLLDVYRKNKYTETIQVQDTTDSCVLGAKNLEDSNIEQSHALLKFSSSGITISDFGTGLYLNEHEITNSKSKIKEGDILRFRFNSGSYYILHCQKKDEERVKCFFPELLSSRVKNKHIHQIKSLPLPDTLSRDHVSEKTITQNQNTSQSISIQSQSPSSVKIKTSSTVVNSYWNDAEFETSERKNKFLKLMGALKSKSEKSNNFPPKSSNISSEQEQEQKKEKMSIESQKNLNLQLEKQYSSGLSHNRSTCGLGYSES